MRYTKKSVYGTATRIADLTKKALAVTEPHKTTLEIPGVGDIEFNSYHIELMHVDGINTITITLFEMKDGYNMDDICKLAVGIETGCYNPSRNSINLTGCCNQEGLLGLTFYEHLAHEVNHYWQEMNMTHRMTSSELMEYMRCVALIRDSSQKDNWMPAWRYYASRKNEIDSNIQGFAHVIDIFSVKPDGKEIVDEWYNWKKDEIWLVLDGIDRTEDPSVSRNFMRYSNVIDRIYSKAVNEMAI